MHPNRLKKIRTTKAMFSKKKIVDSLIKRTPGFNGADRLVTIWFDEMKI